MIQSKDLIASEGSRLHAERLSLRELVLLAGSAGANQLIAGTGRAPFDLPLTPDRTVLGMWQDQAEGMARALGIESLVVRLMLDHRTPMPSPPVASERVRVVIERDPQEYRGSGGVLADLAGRLAPEDSLLVANASQVLLEPLATLVTELVSTGGDVAILGQGDDTPSGLMWMRAGALASVKPIGYVDLKEQALPSIAERHDVRVAFRDQPAMLPTRTLTDYIEALRVYHRSRRGTVGELSPFDEQWQSTFALLEPGVRVKAGARLHDSVALRGAMIERDAVIVRSVVGPGGVVRAGDMVVEQIVTGERDVVAAGLARGRGA